MDGIIWSREHHNKVDISVDSFAHVNWMEDSGEWRAELFFHGRNGWEVILTAHFKDEAKLRALLTNAHELFDVED